VRSPLEGQKVTVDRMLTANFDELPDRITSVDQTCHPGFLISGQIDYVKKVVRAPSARRQQEAPEALLSEMRGLLRTSTSNRSSIQNPPRRSCFESNCRTIESSGRINCNTGRQSRQPTRPSKAARLCWSANPGLGLRLCDYQAFLDMIRTAILNDERAAAWTRRNQVS
jgi:hypothetical protein